MQEARCNHSAAAPGSQPTTAGIYVHVPFCVAKCQYCDFYSITDLAPIPDYIDALLAEITGCRQRVDAVDTIYFGGGTPSLLSPRQIERILDHFHDCFGVDPAVEVTLEANPGTVDRQRLAGYRSAGVNRLNIGLQSLSDTYLRRLGRIHTARQGMDTLEWARQSGFENIGLDLIYGIPGQDEAQWRSELSAVVDLGAHHLSCYTLTLEPGTMLSRKVAIGEITPLAEAATGALFALTGEFLNSHGYRQYEVSNFARVSHAQASDYRSRHNRKYWTFAPYLGFGPAAHSFMDNRRWWNFRSLEEYLAALQSGRSPVAGRETLSRDQQIMEFIYLGLRQTCGIDTADFDFRFAADFHRGRAAELIRLVEEGLIECLPRRIRATARGMRFLDHVIERLIV